MSCWSCWRRSRRAPATCRSTPRSTAGFVDTASLDAEYWYRNLRGTVGFEPAVRALIDDGAHSFIEVSSHPVLTMAVEQTIEALDAAETVRTFGSLRRGDGGLDRFAASLAEAHVAGVPVDWPAFYAGTGARRVELPTYAFQRERYWMLPAAGVGDLPAAGLLRLSHPVLSAAVQVADRDEWVFTGRLSQDTAPWVTDHAMFGSVLVPGTALVELALTAGGQVDAPVLDELVLAAPLVLPDDVSVQLQVTVAAADADGRREVAIYSRPESADEDGERSTTCHARGVLAAAGELPVPFPASLAAGGCRQVSVDGLYARLADAGYEYGPLFQGLRAAWRDGDTIYTEVALPADAGAEVLGENGFALHPALLDAALHGGLLDKDAGSAVELPFSFSGVRLGTGGGSAGGSRVRVRMTPAAGSGLRIDVVDEAGAPVVSVAALALRPIDPAQLDTAQGGQSSLFQLDWVPVPAADAPVVTGRVAVLGDLAAAGDRFADLDALELALADGAPAPDAVLLAVPAVAGAAAAAARAVAGTTLELLQRWLASEALAEARLVVVTRNGVAVGAEAPDLALAPVWGLVRSAQSEHPGRFVAGRPGRCGRRAGLGSAADAGRTAGRGPRWRDGGAAAGSRAVGCDGRPWRLAIERKGSLEGLGSSAPTRSGRWACTRSGSACGPPA